jgi:hypothetical protein
VGLARAEGAVGGLIEKSGQGVAGGALDGSIGCMSRDHTTCDGVADAVDELTALALAGVVDRGGEEESEVAVEADLAGPIVRIVGLSTADDRGAHSPSLSSEDAGANPLQCYELLFAAYAGVPSAPIAVSESHALADCS